MIVQLVHESVLTIEHYLKNLQAGKTTVLLIPVTSKEEAALRLRAFCDRVRQKLPASNPDITAYCCGSESVRSCRKLFGHLNGVIQSASPKPPRIIEHRRDWQA